MVLTLEVVGQQASKLGAAARKVFSGTGGTIGRLPENEWPIPDPYISGRHARIDFRDGGYYLVDTSTNGVFVNAQDNRLVRLQPYLLRNGDRIFIDAYEIRVGIAGPAPSQSPSPLADLFNSNAVAVVAPARNDELRSGVGLTPPNSGANNPRGSSDPFASTANEAPNFSSRPFIPAGPMDESSEQQGSESIDPLKLLGLDRKPSNSDALRARDLAGKSPLSDHYIPPVPLPPTPIAPPNRTPAASANESAIPDDYDPLSDALPADRKAIPSGKPHAQPPVQAPASSPSDTALLRPAPGRQSGPSPAPQRPSPAAAPASSASSPVATRPIHAPPPQRPKADNEVATSVTGKHPDLRGLLMGAGLSEAQISPELIETFGRILRVVVAGLMDVLRARERIKDEFRMRMTTFKTIDNNPLKFSANVDDALHNLLVKRNAAYLGPVEAFEDAFQDVRNHQMAMLAGVRVAFDAMLAEFDPDRMQEQFDRLVKKGSLLSGPAKLRYWELYVDRFRDMVKDRESAFRDLFGEEFAHAYEEQLERLKAISRANKK